MCNHKYEKYMELTPKKRSELVKRGAKKISVPGDIVTKDHIEAYKKSQVLNEFLNEYINKITEGFEKTDIEINNEIKTIFDNFIDTFIRDIDAKLSSPKPSSYTIADTPALSLANTFTRSLSTKLGEVWEKIACISPKVVSPDIDFGIKIKGVDVIILLDGNLTYTQIKTMKGTLTGSQVTRSISELKLHDHSLFVGALDLGTWTFSSEDITRQTGEEFWSRIDLDYSEIHKLAGNVMKKLEESFNTRL